jgi:prefoldin subunit 1
MSDTKGDNKAIELYDIKQEIVNNSYKLKIVEKNVNTIAVKIKKNDIVGKELENLSKETKVYDRVGRLFVLSEKDRMSDKLKDETKKLTVDFEQQKELLKKLQENISEGTKHYNELAKNISVK